MTDLKNHNHQIMANDFWDQLDRLIQISEVIIDRPKGSAHPRYPNTIYPLDYGYLKNSGSGDGRELDVWVGSAPDKGIDEILCTIDLSKKDIELKILLNWSEAEVNIILEFHNSGSMRAMLIRR